MKVSYYTCGQFQVIDVIDALQLNFSMGCVVKYILRAGKKQGEEATKDLTKALDYLKHQLSKSDHPTVCRTESCLCDEDFICDTFGLKGNLKEAIRSILSCNLEQTVEFIQNEITLLNKEIVCAHQMTLEEYIQLKEHPMKKI